MRTGDNMKLAQEPVCQVSVLMVLSLPITLPESYFNICNDDVHNGIQTFPPEVVTKMKAFHTLMSAESWVTSESLTRYERCVIVLHDCR
jgi:hypothetical protein